MKEEDYTCVRFPLTIIPSPLCPFFLDRRGRKNMTARQTRLDPPGLEVGYLALTTAIYYCNF